MDLNLELYKDVTSDKEAITPEIAQKWLEEGLSENRDIRNGTVKRYIKDLQNNRWFLNGETFVVGKSGKLLNGYHRCSAIVASGISIVSIVVRGVDDDTYKTMDGGTNRNPADILKAYGVLSYTREKAGSVSKYLSFLCGKRCIISAVGDTNLTASGKIGNRNMQVLDTYTENQEIFDDAIMFALNIKKANKNSFSMMRLTPGDISALIVYLHKNMGYPVEKVKEFFNELYEMDGKSDKLFMNDFCNIMRDDFKNINKMLPKTRQSFLAKAWNMYNGKILSKNNMLMLTREEEKQGVSFM